MTYLQSPYRTFQSWIGAIAPDVELPPDGELWARMEAVMEEAAEVKYSHCTFTHLERGQYSVMGFSFVSLNFA